MILFVCINLLYYLAISYTVDEVFFAVDASGNAVETPTVAATPDRQKFKKITVRVTYNNRTVT